MKRSGFTCALIVGMVGCGQGDGNVAGLEGFVCGADGQTYTVAEAAEGEHDVAHRGRCDDPMDCGSPNDCFAGDVCAPHGDDGATRPESDVCIPIPTNCPCAGVFEPVCGDDGRTYINACEARCVDIGVAFPGMCKDDPCALVDCAPGFRCEVGECVPIDCVCDLVYAPVCGADGNTYGNACEAECRGVMIVDEGACDGCQDDRDCDPDEICLDWPQGDAAACVWIGCDSDAQCRPGERCVIEDICRAPAVVGECDAAFPRWFHNAETGACEEFIWGGCGGNDNNFESQDECEAACSSEGVLKLSLAARAGTCEPDVFCPEGRLGPEIYAPVCGVDGVTYGSPCEAERVGVEIAYDGECVVEVTCLDRGCPDGWTCDFCQTSDDGPRWVCLSPLAGACLPPDNCPDEGCPDGSYCGLCWTSYECIPEGAVC